MKLIAFLFVYVGASACVELQKYDDAVRWCDEGLAVSLQSVLNILVRVFLFFAMNGCLSR